MESSTSNQPPGDDFDPDPYAPSYMYPMGHGEDYQHQHERDAAHQTHQASSNTSLVPPQHLPGIRQITDRDVNADWSTPSWGHMFTAYAPLSSRTFFRSPQPDEHARLIKLPGYSWNDWESVRFMAIKLGMRVGSTKWRVVHKIAHMRHGFGPKAEAH